MNKISIIRAELAKDINRSAKLIAEQADCETQYVNMVRRKIKADLINPKVSEKPKRKSPKAVGIASLYLPKPDVPKKKNFYNPEHDQYYLIGSAAIICIFAYVIWLAMK